MLKGTVTQAELEALPEPIREHYVADPKASGSFRLASDAIDALNQALGNERKGRNSDAAKIRELEGVAEKFKDIDPDVARAAMEKAREIEEGKTVTGVDHKRIVGERETAIRTEMTKQVDTATKRGDTFFGIAKRMSVGNAIRDAAGKLGIKSEAVEDVMLHAEREFDVEVDEESGTMTPVLKAKDGSIVFGAKGAKSPEEWLTDKTKDRPHWLKESTGGDIPHRGDGKGGSVSITQADAQDVSKYREAKERAKKAGVPLTITA